MLKLIEDLGMIYVNENSKMKKHYAIYECPFCKTQFRCYVYNATENGTQSCGCLQKQKVKSLKTKHNMYNHRIYRIYQNIRARCLNSKGRDFASYGGRGIKICDEWLNDFMSFYNWAIENGYQDNLSIDRIDNNGNYEPSNCRWTTQSVQSRNTRKLFSHNKSGFRGAFWRKDKNKWNAKITVNNKIIHIGYFDTGMEAAKAYDNYVIENNLEHTKNFE